MILFLNVFITDTHVIGNGTYQNREMAKNSDKLDIFKYCISSISKIYPWSKVIINTKLDENYKHRREELNNWIYSEFSGHNLVIRNYRNETQEQWQADYELLDDNLIWFSGNHDHIFIDNNYKYFRNFVDKFSDKTEKIGLQFSHWPEFIREPYDFGTASEVTADFVKMVGRYNHSLQIISKKLYEYFWFSFELPKNQIWGRTDNFVSDIFDQNVEIFIPMREFCRHFDGYQHCARPYPNQIVPVLEIPDGFFDSNIKINYSQTYKDNYTNLNPKTNLLRIYSHEGTDFWYSKSFIPTFWLPKIKDFIHDFSDDENTLDHMYLTKQLQCINSIPNNDLKFSICKAYYS